MSSVNPYQYDAAGGVAAAYAEESERASFIRNTYLHLAGAVMALVAIEGLLFGLVPAATMHNLVLKMGGLGWILVLGLFMVVSWVARSWAESGRGRGMQYAGLGLYVVAEAFVLLPALYFAMRHDPNTPMIAATMTGVVFVGLTAFVFVTRVDLQWMGKILFIAGIVAFGLVVCSVIFQGFSLGIVFSGIMVGLAAGYILYDTSNVLHHYRTEQHVAASLALFSSVALLFWYILRIVMAFGGDE